MCAVLGVNSTSDLSGESCPNSPLYVYHSPHYFPPLPPDVWCELVVWLYGVNWLCGCVGWSPVVDVFPVTLWEPKIFV